MAAASAVAGRDPVKDLCEEATCPVCLEYFKDPVTTECGHNFCQTCLTQCWEESGSAEISCPQCREKVLQKNLRPNRQLANMVEIAKELSFQVTSHEGNREVIPKMSRRNRVITGHNFRRRRTKMAVKPKEGEKGGRHQEAEEKRRGCKKHQEPFKLFCKDHEALICVVCDKSKEHENHKVIPLDEASEAYKARIWNLLETLKKERENILAYKAEIEQESQSLLTQTKTEKGKTLVAFRQMHQFLEEQEKLLLVQMEEVEKEISAKREDHLARLSEELSSLEGLIREMEEKHQQSATELLQDIGSFLQGCEKKEKFENPVAFPPALKWKIWDFCDINPFLEGVMKQFKDTLESGLQQKKAKVTLDPKTAHPHLILSEDHRTVTCGENLQDLPDNPERFNLYPYVLGCEGFPGGRHFWEVTVRSEEVWAVGVARKSVRRKGFILSVPTAGIWEIGKWGNPYKAHDLCDPYTYLVLPLREEPKRIRVTVNCEGDRLAFYNADTAALIFEYLSVGFSEETLLPSFYVHRKGHLMISP